MDRHLGTVGNADFLQKDEVSASSPEAIPYLQQGIAASAGAEALVCVQRQQPDRYR